MQRWYSAGVQVQRCSRGGAEVLRCRSAEVQKCRGAKDVQVQVHLQRCRWGSYGGAEMLKRCRGAYGGAEVLKRCRGGGEGVQRRGWGEVQVMQRRWTKTVSQS